MSIPYSQLAIASVALLLCACTSTGHQGEGFEPCSAHGLGWERLPEVPANSAELLNLDSGGRPVHDQLAAGIPLKEVWLSEGRNRLMVCRYEVSEGVCPLAISVEFVNASNGWSAGPVLSGLCVE